MTRVGAGRTSWRWTAVGVLFAAFAADGASTTSAVAHPHVFPLVEATALFDEAGRFAGVWEKWRFDTEFSVPIKLSLDENQDGDISDAEIAKSLAPHGVLVWIVGADYFTRLTVAGRQVAHAPPRDVSVTFRSGQMLVEFTLPLKEPAAVVLGAGFDVFDPEFYFDFEFEHPDVATEDKPANCAVAIRDKANVDPVAAMLIRMLGLKTDPAVIADPAAGYSVRVAIDCK